MAQVTINNKSFEIGTQVQIAGEQFKVLKINDDYIFFGKVLNNGQMAKPGAGTMGSYSFAEIANYLRIGAIA